MIQYLKENIPKSDLICPPQYAPLIVIPMPGNSNCMNLVA